MKKLDLTNIEEAGNGGQRLPAGGYVCRITKVEDFEANEYLRFEFDIHSGEYKDYFKKGFERLHMWPYDGSYIRSYKPAALPFFKRMCSAISKSNGNFVFDGGQVNSDEQTLVGKCIGLVLGEEEYIGNDGNIRTRLRVANEYTVADINNGNFKVPDPKKLPEDSVAQSTPQFTEQAVSEDDDLPFA